MSMDSTEGPVAGPSSPPLNPPALQSAPSFGITPRINTESPSPANSPTIPTLPVVVVSYQPGSGPTRTVKARIDANVPIDEVVRQLCASSQLSVPGDPSVWALRDTVANDLVTQDNVFGKVSQGSAAFRLVSPSQDAADMVQKLEGRDDKVIKMVLFSLKDHLKEAVFADEFNARGGCLELISICRAAPIGNTLAYALGALLTMTELESGWEGLDPEAVARLCHLVNHATPVNVLRPATALLRKLIVSGPSARPASTIGVQSPVATEHTVWRYGFRAVWPAIILEDDLLTTLAKRIAAGAAGDFGLAQASLSLVNALMKGSHTSDSFADFEDRLDKAEMRKSVVRLMEHQRSEEILPLVLAFQSHVIATAHRLITTDVVAEDAIHVGALISMADKAKALDARHRAASGAKAEDEESDLEARKWKTTGFESENLLQDFEGVGVLGLKLMQRFVDIHGPEFEKLMLEQLARPENKRCPFAKASNECTEILAELYDWNTPDATSAPSTVFHPFMLLYPRAHSLALSFWFKMWNSSGATTTDFSRVGTLVRSQVKGALRNEKRSWSEVQKEFEEADYTKVRDRQMQELALEDEFLSKAPVRNLRSRLYQQSFDFIRNQRIQALVAGSWFAHNVNVSREGRKGGIVHPRVWRFYRLGPNRKFLHYVERTEKTAVPATVEEMPDRIDVSTITDIIPFVGSTTPGAASSGRGPLINRTNSIRFSAQPSIAATDASSSLFSTTAPSYTFSLMHGDHLVAELTAPDGDTYSEWVDGLNLLRPEGYISTKETADLVHTLTQIGTQIKLLDLSGERIEVPSNLTVPPVPLSCDFYYADGAVAA